MNDSGQLVLAGCPIGNVSDTTERLRLYLAQVDVIAAEDTRRLNRLLGDLGIAPRATIVSYHDHNERDRTGELVEHLHDGRDVLVITDAGMPSVSDPGYRVAKAAADAGLPVTCLPGPSAVTVALALSGLPSDRFAFDGFLPRKPGERRSYLRSIVDEPRTLVVFESPRRLATTLTECAEIFEPERQAAVCRELTKTHEEVARGTFSELCAWSDAKGDILGEITVVIAPSPPKQADVPTLARIAVERSHAGERLKAVCKELAAEHGASARDIFETATHDVTIKTPPTP